MRLWLALAVSAGLHAAVGLGVWLRPAPAPGPVTAAPEIATRVTLFDAPRRSERKTAADAEDNVNVAARARAAAHRPATSPSPSPSTSTTTSTSTSTSTSPSATSDADETASPIPATLGPVTSAVATPFDPTALHAALAESARRCYPAAAKRWNLTGEALVDFCLDGAGALKSTHVSASSGQAMLDTAASGCVIEGALPLPAEAAGGCYSVPVRFGR